jgi:hypothetical protein
MYALLQVHVQEISETQTYVLNTSLLYLPIKVRIASALYFRLSAKTGENPCEPGVQVNETVEKIGEPLPQTNTSTGEKPVA